MSYGFVADMSSYLSPGGATGGTSAAAAPGFSAQPGPSTSYQPAQSHVQPPAINLPSPPSEIFNVAAIQVATDYCSDFTFSLKLCVDVHNVLSTF